ncbi:MAG: carboxylesterase family protein [Planctomycetota bacterium]|jgi:pimeloyl-ACP methyl ester carboxylesterase
MKTTLLLLMLIATPWNWCLAAGEPARSAGGGQAAERPARRRQAPASQGVSGKVEHYVSEMDGKRRPYAVSATGTGDVPRPMIVEVSPGGTDLQRGVRLTESIAAIAAKHGISCIVVRPTGRGPGSVNQNYGEVDTLEAIDDAARKHNADRDRITITGSSMGGAATWYLISHNPDRFAGGAPFCGYCDYRLWEKPGGLTFHMHPWEEPSWRARSAVLLIENFEHTPLWIVHGAWDRSVGGGVSVEQSRQMTHLLEEKGFPHQYTEVPATGHGCRTPEIWEKVILWLLQQKKTRSPDHVCLVTFSQISGPDHLCLVTYELRHNRSYWITIDQLDKYAERARLDARRTDEGRVAVTTENVCTLSLGPIADASSVQVTIDGQEVAEADLARPAQFRREADGAWRLGQLDVARQKHHGCSGPIGDLFHENVILVPGTAGSEDETFFLAIVSGNARRFFRGRNGGVHRGGIMGENNVDLPLVPDSQLSDEDRAQNNLLLYGTYSTNSILKSFEGRLPLQFGEDSITVAGRTFEGDKVAVFAVFQHPENPDRYVAVHGGVTPDAVTWGSHLDMQLLPDYLAYNGGELLGWGFLDNRWKPQE